MYVCIGIRGVPVDSKRPARGLLAFRGLMLISVSERGLARSDQSYTFTLKCAGSRARRVLRVARPTRVTTRRRVRGMEGAQNVGA